METEPSNPPGLAFRLCCFILPVIALGIIYEFTGDLSYSVVASLVVASIPPLAKFIYELNAEKQR